MKKNTTLQPEDLRFLFVQFLFGLTAAEVAVKFSDLFLKSHLFSTPAFWPLLSHLVLATVLIGTSWVGWSNSTSAKTIRGVKSVFSKPFVVLIFDVILVIMYYMLVRSTGITGENQRSSVSDLITVEYPTRLVAFIFIVYLVWDIITKWPITRKVLLRITLTFICACFAFLIWFFLHTIKDTYDTRSVYAALLFLDLSFRALKDPSGDENTWFKEKQSWGWLFLFVVILFTIFALVGH